MPAPPTQTPLSRLNGDFSLNTIALRRPMFHTITGRVTLGVYRKEAQRSGEIPLNQD